MSEATEKQISFAKSLGIDNADKFTKEALKSMIDVKLQEKGQGSKKTHPSNEVIGSTGGISEVRHIFQNAYEFGPAGNRHNIRYWDIEDLKKQMKEIEEAGYFIEVGKI